MNYFSDYYNSLDNKIHTDFTGGIKWSRNLKKRFERGLKESYQRERIIKLNYRPFVPTYLYFSEVFIDENGLIESFFTINNLAYCITGPGSSKSFQLLAIKSFSGLDYLEKTQCLPLFRYDDNGVRFDSITDWGLEQFISHYNDQSITKVDIFHYTYAVLHNPAYRKKYELNLKHEFPRIPFYDDFWKWAACGKQLMDLQG